MAGIDVRCPHSFEFQVLEKREHFEGCNYNLSVDFKALNWLESVSVEFEAFKLPKRGVLCANFALVAK